MLELGLNFYYLPQVDPDHMKEKEIEDIFNELEDCYRTDSDPEEDEISIMSVLSTPRPTLRPFFSEGMVRKA